jgi:hypothetical protein
MRMRIPLFMIPLFALAQAPPLEVDHALRSRVTEFYQDHVDGNFRKAFDLVAEDTKDSYFGANKTQFKSFHIDKIDYLDNFTKAIVTLTVQRTMTMQGQQVSIPSTGPTNWKIENGKWVWYVDSGKDQATPMGPSDPSVIKPKPDGTITVPRKLTPELIAEAAQRILQQQQSGVSKPEVTLAGDKPSSEEFVFHNAVQGSVQVKLDMSPEVPGLHAELDKTSLKAGDDAVVKLRYEPSEKPPESPVTLRLMIAPFNQVFTVTVKFL